MRDPKRIRKMLNEFADIWESKASDWRLGQILNNIFGTEDIFYMEDDEFMKHVRNFFNTEEK